jgi:hypothetical protein
MEYLIRVGILPHKGNAGFFTVLDDYYANFLTNTPESLSRREREVKPFSLWGERSEGGGAGWDEGVW